jgi:hypothetical protein
MIITLAKLCSFSLFSALLIHHCVLFTGLGLSVALPRLFVLAIASRLSQDMCSSHFLRTKIALWYFITGQRLPATQQVSDRINFEENRLSSSEPSRVLRKSYTAQPAAM